MGSNIDHITDRLDAVSILFDSSISELSIEQVSRIHRIK